MILHCLIGSYSRLKPQTLKMSQLEGKETKDSGSKASISQPDETETCDKILLKELTCTTDGADPTKEQTITYTTRLVKKTDLTPNELSDMTKTYVLEEKTTPTTKASDVEMKEVDQEALDRYKPALERCLAMAPPPPPGGGRTMILKPLDVVPMEDGGKKIVVTDDPVKAVRPGTPVEKKD